MGSPACKVQPTQVVVREGNYIGFYLWLHNIPNASRHVVLLYNIGTSYFELVGLIAMAVLYI